MFEWLKDAKTTDGKPAMAMVFTPSLVSLIARAERLKGSPLTEAEALEVRNKAIGLVMPAEASAHIAQRRGYVDLDPDQCWEQWRAVRNQLGHLDSEAETKAANEYHRLERIKRMPEVAASPRHAGGPPCPKCGKPLRTALARQCFLCGARFDGPPPAAT